MWCIWHSALWITLEFEKERRSLQDVKKSKWPVIRSLPCPINRSINAISDNLLLWTLVQIFLGSLRKGRTFSWANRVLVAFTSKQSAHNRGTSGMMTHFEPLQYPKSDYHGTWHTVGAQSMTATIVTCQKRFISPEIRRNRATKYLD